MISLFFRLIGFLTSSAIAAALVYLCFALPNKVPSESETVASNKLASSATTATPSRGQELGKKVDQTIERVETFHRDVNQLMDSANRLWKGDQSAAQPAPEPAKEEKEHWFQLSNIFKKAEQR